MVVDNKKDISSIELQIKLPNSKIFNIKGTDFKYKLHYDQLDDKAILSLEKQVNYIFHAYKKRYTLPVDADVTFEGYIYNNLRDYIDAYPEIQAGLTKRSYNISHYIGLSHYLSYGDDIKLLPKYQLVLAQEIAHSLNYYNWQKRGIHMITKGNRTEHDEVYAFGLEVRREMSILLEKKGEYNRKLFAAVQRGYVSEVTDLLNEGAEINAEGDLGETPLHTAKDEGIARLLTC